MNLKPIAQPDTPEWHELRSQGLGASEAAMACGLSKYGQPLKLYSIKRGEMDPDPETDVMRRGRLFEPGIVAEFPHVTGINVAQYPMGLFRHPDHDFILATPDADLENGELLETKMTTWRRGEIGEEDTDNLPTEWVMQAQQQMLVLGRQRVRLAVFIDIATYKLFRIDRNEALIAGIVDAEAELWERIRDGRPPEPDWTHPRSLDLIRELHDTIEESRIVLSPASVEKWERYEAAGREIKALTDERKALKAAVLHEIGDHYAGILPGGRMVRRKLIERAGYTVEPSSYIDIRAVKQDAGPVIEGDPIISIEQMQTRFEMVDELLTSLGFECYEISASGSRYYVTDDGGERVRVADHSPNQKTAAWMERRDVKGIQVDVRVDDDTFRSVVEDMLRPAFAIEGAG